MSIDKRNGLVDANHTSPQKQSKIQESDSANLDQNNSTSKRKDKYFNGAVYLSPRRWYIYNPHGKHWQRSTKEDLAVRLHGDGYNVKAMLEHIQMGHAVDAVVLPTESVLVTHGGRRDYTGELDHLPMGVHTLEDGRRVLMSDEI
jgi:hypothetical protein